MGGVLDGFRLDNSYARDLEGLYLPVKGYAAPAPQVVRVNAGLAAELGLDAAQLASAEGAAVLSGAVAPEGTVPLAMAYAGHQFGGFSPQLGDGRALLLAEGLDTGGQRRDIHLKGSGRTAFSRGGDGKATLAAVLREYLIGEAMQAMGIPTTRALAATLTGEEIQRDGYERGAVLARVGASHLRVGTFQFFAARGEIDKLRRLADYAIARHFPDVMGREDRYLEFFRRVRDGQARLIAQWLSVGFVHGVMNTDNMAISGETIDYGPCAFIDAYDPQAVFSSIDRNGRYAYRNQAPIAHWNLTRLAETLIDLVDPKDNERAIALLTEALEAFAGQHDQAWLAAMRAKLGLARALPGDGDLAEGLLTMMAAQGADFTNTFRHLAGVLRGQEAGLLALLGQDVGFAAWVAAYRARIGQEARSPAVCAGAMDGVNPVYIPRNHLVEAALTAARADDLAPFEALLARITQPFTKQPGAEAYAQPAPPEFGAYTTFCGT